MLYTHKSSIKVSNEETIGYLTEVSHRPENIDYLEVKGLRRSTFILLYQYQYQQLN